jgi:DNA replication protein DnaC
MTKITETTGLDASRKLLEEMGFEQAQHILPELLEQAVKDNASFSDFLERLLRKEREYREERRVKTSLKLSGLPCGKTLENFDFTFQRSVVLALFQNGPELPTLPVQELPGMMS